MELTDENIKKYGKNVVIVIETVFYHTNMNLLAFDVIIAYSNENMNSLKYNAKKVNFIKRLKYAEQKIFCICIDV